MAHTMREVARRAGVSLATVSRVLNNTQYISEETRRRVLDAVREFNYFKNVHARRLATGAVIYLDSSFPRLQSILSRDYPWLSGNGVEPRI